jgi:hypothetical protein
MSDSQPKSLNEELRERAAKALISYAVFRWESAVTLAVTLMLVVFLPDPFRGLVPLWRWWFWVILGVAAEAAIIATSLYDPDVREQVISGMFRERFDPSQIRDANYRQKIAKALDYRDQIEFLLQRARDGVLRMHLEATADDISDWINSMFGLAQRLDGYKNSVMVHQDLRSLPVAIRELEQRLAVEKDAQIRAQIERTIDNKRAQLKQLQLLENTMERAELQLDETLSAMGTIYAQVQLIGAKDIDNSRAQRLRSDIADEVHSLHDIVETMDELYQSSEPSIGRDIGPQKRSA